MSLTGFAELLRTSRASHDDGAGERRRPDASTVRARHRELVRRDLADDVRRTGLAAAVRAHGTPLVALDPARVAARLVAVRRELPDAAIHVAVSALPHPAVVRAVHAFGASFAVGSRAELDLVEGVGADVVRCLHANPARTPADLTSAVLRGVRTFAVDGERDLDAFRGLPVDVGVLIRLAPARRRDDAGCGATDDDAARIVAACLRAGRAVHGVGLPTRGRGATDAASVRRETTRALGLVATLERRFGVRMTLLDLGDPFPAATGSPVPPPGVVGRSLRDALTAAPPHLRISVSPAASAVASAAVSVTRVIGSSDRPDGRWHRLDDDLRSAITAAPDAGAAARPLVFRGDEVGLAASARGRPASEFVPATLAGPRADRGDVVVRRMPLPPLADGDLLVAPVTGPIGWAAGAPTSAPVVVLGPARA